MWQMAVMSSMTLGLLVTVAVIRSRLPDLSSHPPVSMTANRVLIGDKRLPRNQWFWLKRWHVYIYESIKDAVPAAQLERWRESRQTQGFAIEQGPSETRFVIGLFGSSEAQVDLVQSGPHLLIIGPTGSGKSECFKLILHSLLASQESANLQFFLIDFKGGATFAPLAASKSVVGFATDLDVAAKNSPDADSPDCWATIQTELESRGRAFARAKVANFEAFKKTDAAPMARLIIAVDELGAAFQSSVTAARALEAVVTRGRSLGVHIVAANQTLVGLPRLMLTNFRLRIALGGVDPIELNQLGAKAQAIRSEHPSPELWRNALLIEQGSGERQFLMPIACDFEPAV